MLASLLCLLACVQSTDAELDQAAGLRDLGTESRALLRLSDRSRAAVRFLDGATSRPVAGVRVELWTEEGVEPLVVATRLSVLTSGRDGGLVVPTHVGGVHADKFRVSCAGYASRELHGRPDEGEFLLQPARARAFRVLDLDGRPIAGATLALRESCDHAVPACVGTTDVAGEVTLDDYPFGVGELEVVAEGFGALSHLLLDHSVLDDRAARFGEPVELRLARRPGFHLEVVDDAGAPLVGRRLIHMRGPVVAAWTDPHGQVFYSALDFVRDARFELLDGRGQATLDTELLPTVGITRVARRSRLNAVTGPHSRVRVVLQGLEADLPRFERPTAFLRTSRGRAIELHQNENEFYLPVGPTRVQVGANFSGWCEEVRDVDLRELGREEIFELRREGTLVVTLPDQPFFLHAQVGYDSVTRDELDEQPLVLHVPPDAPIVLWLERTDGSAYRSALAPLASGESRAVSMLDAGVRQAPDVEGLPKCRLRFDVRVAGASVGAGEMHARLSYALGREEIELDGTSHFDFELPRGDLYRVQFTCDASRCVPLAVVGRVPDAAESVRSVELVARARVTFARAEAVFGPGSYSVNPSLEQPGLDEDGVDLAPGLALLEVYEGKEKRVVELDLKPGEVRALEEP